MTELANAIENVQSPREFYQQTGRSDFSYGSQNPVFGLTIQKLELAHLRGGRHTFPQRCEPPFPPRRMDLPQGRVRLRQDFADQA
ncbi:hypothetical protein ACVOMV_36620 [Mesorhizobium atlanticum]